MYSLLVKIHISQQNDKHDLVDTHKNVRLLAAENFFRQCIYRCDLFATRGASRALDAMAMLSYFL